VRTIESDPAAEADVKRVVFADGFSERCALLVARFARRQAGREGVGRSNLLGPGEDFAGHRPYREGEDLRRLDWDLLARLDKPFVRVERREAGERWAIWLDRSASMGIGPPGKLQRAAECAAGLARVGLALGARVRVVLSRGADSGQRSYDLRHAADWGGLLAFLQAARAAGDGGLIALSEVERAGSDRLFGIGDFFDGDPSRWFVHRARGRRLAGVQILAPQEFSPTLGATRWIDPEDGRHVEVVVDDALLTAYERRLEERIAAWHTTALRHGSLHTVGSSASPFEDLLQPLLGD
jgi:uncharacterized protein (DUF58 family)